MGKIKSWYRSIPLWLAIFLFAAAAIIIASIVSNRVTSAANLKIGEMELKYIFLMDDTDNSNEHTFYSVTGVQAEVVSYKMEIEPVSEDDKLPYAIYRLTLRYAPILIYSVSLLAAVLLLYFTKLKKPLALLLSASAKIAENDFDFSLDYSGHDEMARLCRAFEKMRSALYESRQHMSRMIEERKQLNDAYTHDIRTPIAVLKGYSGILTKFLPTGQLPPEKVISTVNTMEAHIERLEQFANSMNKVQKLADVVIRRELVRADELVGTLRDTAMLLCEKKHLICEFDPRIKAQTLNIDASAVTQVFENLLGNATRFAKSKVTVRLDADESALTVRVADDGDGFTEKALSSAAMPYYSGEQNEETYHFGLGLYICKTLSEKHGGSLTIENGDGGGAAVTSTFGF